ncbi:BLUF domain-containing protein [Phenylobacterium sp.]|uniref:BLUF domain-containing protein n=1 Tax=Phenylobacterium sp. TaxID=1871053 RepID=UPI00286B706F|nr:BLUF domain-containing protein [Phenylobacterium sp.]
MSSIRRITYASRLSANSGLITPEGLRGILDASMRNNARVGVTGMLLCHQGSFLQILEGPSSAVEFIYKRVKTDSRHHGLKTLADQMVAAPSFPKWAMCGKNITAADDEILAIIASRASFNPFEMNGSDALRLLKTVHAIHVRTAGLQEPSQVVQV